MLVLSCTDSLKSILYHVAIFSKLAKMELGPSCTQPWNLLLTFQDCKLSIRKY